MYTTALKLERLDQNEHVQYSCQSLQAKYVYIMSNDSWLQRSWFSSDLEVDRFYISSSVQGKTRDITDATF